MYLMQNGMKLQIWLQNAELKFYNTQNEVNALMDQIFAFTLRKIYNFQRNNSRKQTMLYNHSL